MHSRFAWLRNERVRLTLLLVVLGSLAVYAVTTWAGVFGAVRASGGDRPDCPFAGAPSLQSVPRARLAELREGLRRMISSQGRVQPYERGVVPAVVAWSDGQPGMHKALPLGPVGPAGYEMRWWMPNGDDMVADVMVFASTDEAHDFLMRASSSRCRTAGTALAVLLPRGGRNLGWRNPEGLAQEDLFLLRGRRVYRVAVVKAGAGGSISHAGRIAAFSLVDALACALPGAACRPARARPGLYPPAPLR